MKYAVIPGLLAGILLCMAMSPAQSSAETLDSPCLLLIDIQNFYFPGGRMELVEPEKASMNAQALLQKFRKSENLVVHVRHNYEPGGEIHPNVKPAAGEKVIPKDHANAFKDTDLLPYLRDHRVKTLVICGMMTHMCVEAAVRAAHDYDFTVYVVHDACTTRALKFSETVVSAQDVHLSTLSALSGSYARVVDTKSLLERLLLN
jgi:nicotinamidase-related amidase